MNPLNALTTPNETMILLLGGVALLLINILYGFARATRGQLKAGWFTVGLVLMACTLIGVGSVQSALASSTPGTFRGGFARPTTTAPASDSSTNSTTPVPDATTDIMTGASFLLTNTPDAPAELFVSNTRSTTLRNAAPTSDTPDTSTTPTPAGNRSTLSAGASRTSSGQGNAGAANGGGTNSFSDSANSVSQPTTLQLDQSGLLLASVGGGLSLILALALYYVERRRTNFIARQSRGLLNTGAGLFTVIAVLIIPIIPGQFSGSVSAAGLTTRAAPIVRRNVPSATPSPTPAATIIPTELPTLTPTMTDTPVALPTQISWLSMQPTATPTPVVQCTVTPINNINLRGDPSTNKPPIGSVPAGTKLSVIGQSIDKQWWQITYNGSAGTQIAWVSITVTTNNSQCNTPVIQASAKP